MNVRGFDGTQEIVMGQEKSKQKKIADYGQMLGEKELKNYEKHLFDVDRFGGKAEADRLIKRYSAKITLSERDEEILRNNVPAAPQFEVLREAEYNKRGCWKRRQYRNQVEGYFKYRKNYYTQKDKSSKGKRKTAGEKFALKRQEMEDRLEKSQGLGEQATELEIGAMKLSDEAFVAKKKEASLKKVDKALLDKQDKITEAEREADNTLADYRKQGFFQDVEEDPDAMDTAYEDMKSSPGYSEAEKDVAKKEIGVFEKMNPWFIQVAQNYSYTDYSIYNRKLREGMPRAIPEMIIKMGDTMKKRPLNRDLVVRRGVNNIATIGYMLGIEDAGSMKTEELKEKLTHMSKSGKELICTERGFTSTSAPYAEKNFDAGTDDVPGIEFMILMKKGSAAVNISSTSIIKDEGEVLAAPGMRFKILKMDLSGNADIRHGNGKSWKIYLVSIPENENKENK